MRRLLKTFLEENITSQFIREDFDYNFNNTTSREEFDKEFQKFLGIYNQFFYSEDRFLTVFNSYEIRLKIDDLRHMFKLLEYTISNNLNNEKIVLIEFLHTYYFGINSRNYKAKYAKHKETKEEFMNTLIEFNLQKDFFTVFFDILYKFYKTLIKLGIKQNIFIDSEIIHRIFNNLASKEDYYNELIEIFINSKNNLPNIIKFDKNKENHKETYLEYIKNSIDEFGGYNYTKEMLLELDKKKCLSNDEIKEVINCYIKVVNSICNDLVKKPEGFIRGIGKIDMIKNELNYILRNIEMLSAIQRSKIRECLIQILSLKRFLLSDDNYVNAEMHKSIHEQKIDTKEVDKIRNNIKENEFALYSVSKVDFFKQMESALELYSEYPLQSIVTRFQFDTQKQVYTVSIEDTKKYEQDNFKKVFDNIGKVYTENHLDMRNILEKDYYEELLKYLSKTFLMQQQLLLLMLGEEEFFNTINKLKKQIGYNYENLYAMIANNIMAIEVNVIKFMKSKNIQNYEDGFLNINALFEIYKDDKQVANGLMYLNYVLYEKSGLNLRNDIAHGTLINTKLEIQLLVSFAGLIFISWLLNAR